MVKLLPLQL